MSNEGTDRLKELALSGSTELAAAVGSPRCAALLLHNVMANSAVFPKPNPVVDTEPHLGSMQNANAVSKRASLTQRGQHYRCSGSLPPRLWNRSDTVDAGDPCRQNNV
jgi:hypothetical protein